MAETLPRRITLALQGVINPRTGADVYGSRMVRDIGTTTDGRVRLTLLLAADDAAELARDVRQAVERVEGVTEVRVDIEDANRASARQTAPPAGQPSRPGRALPTLDAQPPRPAARPPAPTS